MSPCPICNTPWEFDEDGNAIGHMGSCDGEHCQHDVDSNFCCDCSELVETEDGETILLCQDCEEESRE